MSIDYKIHIADIGTLERQEQKAIALRRALNSDIKAIDLENYHTYEEVITQSTLIRIFSHVVVSITSTGHGLADRFGQHQSTSVDQSCRHNFRRSLNCSSNHQQ